MANRRKRDQIDPKRINEYNKFLCTLDEKSFINKENTENKDSKDTKENLDNGIDLLIEAINNNFISEKLFLFNFTGQNKNDVIDVNSTDPNYYRDIIKPISVKSNSNISKKAELNAELNVEIKETIDIDIEVNNITDLLGIIEKYKINR